MRKNVLKVGTLISDNGRLGIISNVIEVGELNPKVPIISWRANYEITYTNGDKLILSCMALEQMIRNKKVKIYYSATPLLYSSPTGSDGTPEPLEGYNEED